ncbi:MAG: hypothetical protein HUJ30_01945 [Gammaproteobacteria bacterium]|nr:hypothetical protein [Gammaproteobacteria bacterium]
MLEFTVAAKIAPNGPRAKIGTGLLCCDEHSQQDHTQMFTDEGWQIICDSFASMGMAEPDRATVQQIMKPIHDA